MELVSLFTGAGGLDLGLERAGLEVAGCLEIDRDACATLALNRPNWRLLEPGDITVIDPHDALVDFGLKPRKAFLVSAGPPCQPYSKAAQWAPAAWLGRDDPRARTLDACMEYVRVFLPRFVLLENVEGFLSHGGIGVQETIRSLFADINGVAYTSYEPMFLTLDAADYGVPQHRRRVFVVADREGGALNLPPATHGDTGSGLRPRLRAWDAIGCMPTIEDEDLTPRGKWAALLPSIPEGKNYGYHTSKGGGIPLFGWRTRYWSFLLKLSKTRPSWTLSAQPGSATGPFHWDSRRLAVAELARLQTFPANVAFSGSRSSVQRQIGNAVPSAIGEFFGHWLLSVGRKTANPIELTLIPERSSVAPPPAADLSPVPARYLSLVGQHSPHPGTGRGPAPRSRLDE